MSDVIYGGDRLGERMPAFNTDNPAELEAWFGPFGYSDHWRKVVLANCREIERARAATKDWKLSEARLDDLARTSDTYIDFLIQNLNGRHQREKNVFESLRAGQ